MTTCYNFIYLIIVCFVVDCSAFLDDLEGCDLDPIRIAACFVHHNEGFVIYTDYCTNYPRLVI